MLSTLLGFHVGRAGNSVFRVRVLGVTLRGSKGQSMAKIRGVSTAPVPARRERFIDVASRFRDRKVWLSMELTPN